MNKYLDFIDAKNLVKSYNLQSRKEFNILYDKIWFNERPFPKECNRYYKDKGWCGWLSYLNSNKRLSIGEHKIKNWLENNKISYYREYTFNDLRINKVRYKFDFYLPKYNTCIEFDGEQHFKPNDFFGGIEEHLKVKIRDEIKNNYCKIKNINLLRIPYFNIDNIEIILNNLLYHE